MRNFVYFCLLMMLSLSMAAAGTTDDSLAVYLKFNEGQGTEVKDSSGHGNSAKLVNAQWEKNGVEGWAVRLNGKDAYIDLGKGKDVNFTQDFTLSLWFKVKTFDRKGRSLWVRGNYSKGWQNYIYKSFIAFASGPGKVKNGVYYCRIAAGDGITYPFTQMVITGKKIDDGKTEITYYLNGKKGKTFTAGKLPVYASLTIGKMASAEGLWFNGIIDEAKIYSRPLTAEEIKHDYEQTLKTGADTLQKAFSPAPGKEVKLPPLTGKRVALFAPGPDFPGAKAAKNTITHLERDLKKLGMQVTRLNTAQVGNEAVLDKKKIDILILPFGGMPFKCEGSVFNFLKNGGCLITASCVPAVWKRDATGKMERKQHTRGWYSPFLIRHLPFNWARRKLDCQVGLNPVAAKAVGDLLPSAAGPYPGKKYCLVDRWDLQPSVTGRPGDSDVDGGKNLCLAADVMLPLYLRANGEATDFHVYRFFNNHIFNGTLIELGAVGRELLNSPGSEKVLRALLYFAGNKLPGEQPKEYYKQINRLHRDWSALGRTYIETLSELRDAAFFGYLNGSGKWRDFNKQLASVEKRMREIRKRKEVWDESLIAGNPKKIKPESDELEKQLTATEQQFRKLRQAAGNALKTAQKAAAVPVKNKPGELLVESFLSLPTNMHMLRDWNYQAKKDIGVNIVCCRPLPIHDWYLENPEIMKQLKKFLLSTSIQYYFSYYMKPRSGALNPVNGTIKDAPPQKYKYDLSRKKLKKDVERWRKYGIVPFRMGLADETGLGLKYWGSEALRDFRQYLAKQYGNDISALNKHWGTKYTSFNTIKLPVRKPVSPAEHAAWEHWRNLREKKFEEYAKLFYDTVKEFSPETAVSNIVSTGSFESPLYGVNFYNMSRYQDINGIDGTCVNPPKEWMYQDLTRKRVLTCEWGGLYTPTTLNYVNGKLWEELTGGALGFDLWCWQFGDARKNYVDFAGRPTLYGNRARGTVKDAKKIEHVIIDGNRVKPEIGILFSHTSRMHDQGWGSHGNATVSPHVLAVTNYYDRLLRFHRSARVVPEEKLLEENIGYLKMLIVPEANYLSKPVQKKLLEYARKGGTLVLEGSVGKFDNFGQPLNMLFRESKVIPSHTSALSITIGSSTVPVAGKDQVFAPVSLSGKAKTLASFGKEPAVLEKSLGKGRIIFIGFSAGLKRYGNFQQLLNRIWQSRQLTPRFIVSDDNVLLREWKHGNDTYLLLASRSKSPETFPLEIKIRGKCNIEDYLFGKDVKTRFADGYTTFKTLMANGGRVFRIPGGAPSASCKGAAFIAPSGSRETVEKTGEKNIKLPFNGNIYADTALKWQGYTFRNSTIASGIDQNEGATYIIVSKGENSQKKRIKVGVDYYFRMREATFKIRSSNNFYKFPFHSTVTIEKVDVRPPEQSNRIKKKDKTIILDNGLMQLRIDSARGGMITEMALTDDQVNQVTSQGCLNACSENIGSVPGPFANQTFASKLVKDTKTETVLELFNKKSLKQKILRKIIRMHNGVAGFEYDLQCTNLDPNLESPPFELRWHPELSIGGVSDNSDVFYIAGAKKIETYNYTPSNSGKSFKNFQGGWAAVVDRKEKLAFVTAFKPKQLGCVYLWLDSSFYDLEIFSHKRQVKKGDSIDLNLTFYMLRGVSGLDAYSEGNGAYVVLPDNIDQKRPVRIVIEVASAYEKILPVKITPALRRENKLISGFAGTITGTVAFDQPVRHYLKANLNSYPDGAYQLDLSIQIGKHPAMTISKKLDFAGNQLAQLMEFYKQSRLSIETLNGNLPPELEKTVFDIRADLEEFRRRLADGDMKKAKTQCKQLSEAIKRLKIKMK